MPGAARLGDTCCFTPDTKISLMNNTNPDIKSLEGLSGFYVYSLDLSTMKVVPGRVERVFRSGVADCVKIGLDNGEYLTCTVNHRMILRSGRMIRADKLKVGDSMMPLYRRIVDKSYSRYGYEEVYHPSGEWQQTHRITYEWKYGRKTYKKKKLYVAHHKDFYSLNNSPENILACSWSDHKKYHSRVHTRRSKVGAHPFQSEKSRKLRLDRNLNNNPAKNPDSMRKMVNTRNSHPDGYHYGLNPFKSDKVRSIVSSRMKSDNPMQDSSIGEKRVRTRKARDLGFGSWDDMIKEVVSRSKIEDLDTILSDINLIGWKDKNLWRSKVLESWPTNHKIVSIEFVGKCEVFNMTVEKHHNYAISAGLFVGNSGHGCWPPRANSGASDNVYINGRGAHRQGDGWSAHTCPPIPETHSSSLASGSSTVYTNGKQQGRIGDPVACGSSDATGSDDVIVGG